MSLSPAPCVPWTRSGARVRRTSSSTPDSNICFVRVAIRRRGHPSAPRGRRRASGGASSLQSRPSLGASEAPPPESSSARTTRRRSFAHARGCRGIPLHQELVRGLPPSRSYSASQRSRAPGSGAGGRSRSLSAPQVETRSADDDGRRPARQGAVDGCVRKLGVLAHRGLVVEVPDRDELGLTRRLVREDGQAGNLHRVGRDQGRGCGRRLPRRRRTSRSRRAEDGQHPRLSHGGGTGPLELLVRRSAGLQVAGDAAGRRSSSSSTCTMEAGVFDPVEALELGLVGSLREPFLVAGAESLLAERVVGRDLLDRNAGEAQEERAHESRAVRRRGSGRRRLLGCVRNRPDRGGDVRRKCSRKMR